MLLDEIISLAETEGLRCNIYKNKCVIENPFHEKHIKIEFSEIEKQQMVEEISFRNFGFEMFQEAEEIRNQHALEIIKDILDGNIYFITKSDAKTGRWLADALYCDEKDVDNDITAYRRTVEKIKNKKPSLFGREKIYECCSWKEYERIIKK